MPGYRMEDILFGGGVNLNRSTIYDWMAAVADITKPLYELMKQLVLQSKIIQTDDTSVKADRSAGGRWVTDGSLLGVSW
ncbi:MAG: transposase [Planctomycetaceae bacterium]